MATSLTVVVLTPTAARADWLDRMTVVTWNMQGESAGGITGANWQTVRRYLRQASIVLLQESGPGPVSSLLNENNRRIPSTVHWTVDGHRYQSSVWNPETERTGGGPYTVTFLQTDTTGGTSTGGRVNISVVSRGVPDQVRVVNNRVQAGRSALGVRFGTTWYFTFHGLSSARNGGEGGGDSADMLDRIDRAVMAWELADRTSYDWVVGGDFNVTPATLETRAGMPPAALYNSGEPTQATAFRELDYVVADRLDPGIPVHRLLRENSDHWPVQVGLDQPVHQPPSPPVPTTVMATGDSITDGVNSSTGNGYRYWYYESLTGISGIMKRSVDFVGSQRSGDMADPHHEGHPGFRIDEIARMTACSVRAHRPNLVTLHAGTNDMNQNHQLDTAPERLGALIDQILRDAPETTVLVATLIPSTKEGMQDKIDRYNAELPRIVDQRRAQGKHVMLVNMGELTTADVDGSHPNDDGYRKMAQAFLDVTHLVENEGWLQPPVAGTGQKCDPDTAAGPGWNPLGVIASGMTHPEGRTDLVELNGDNRADYVRITPNGAVRAALNTPGAPGKPNWVDVDSGIPAGTPEDGAGMRFADINGDGRDDWLQLGPDSSVLAFENQGIANGRIDWSLGKPIAAGVSGATREAIRFADVNGDGRDDYLRTGDTGTVHAYLNTVTDQGLIHWVERLNWAPGVSYGSRDKLRLADVNGDRRADYLMVGSNGAVHAYLNNGGGGAGGFTEHKYFVNDTGYPGDKSTFRDISGDGKADYVVVYDGGSIRCWLNRGGNI
ncbi:GDSL-type esterase/lipase family protein [Streptomyces sp. NPDC093568]|uniref:GDSL-type esterase/lipase family protein n=1 Tax=Streptomyces sp. NPDC093568 TaxID=3366041 RepID=UPI0037FDACB8